MGNKQKCYFSVGEYDDVKNKISDLFDRALTLRGVLNLYVYNNEFTIPVDFEVLTYCAWDIQEPFCELLKQLDEIIVLSSERFLVNVSEHNEEVNENVGE